MLELKAMRIGTLALAHAVPERRNDKPPLLFLHGAWGGKWQFENWQQYAAEDGWESYALDLSGHCESPPADVAGRSIRDYADDVERVVKEIGSCYLLGHSMGGLVAQVVASREPNIKKVVLLASTKAASMIYVNAFVIRLLRYLPQALSRGSARITARDIRHFNAVSPKDAERFVPESLRVLADIMLQRIRASTIPCPVLVVAAQQDRIIPLFVQRSIARTYAADYIEIPSVGHFLMLEDGWQNVLERILEWLRR